MVHINDIQKLPKHIMFDGELYTLSMYVTAWGKLAVAYTKCFPTKDKNEELHIFSQVVEPKHHKIPIYSNDIYEIVDVPNLQYAFITLKARLKPAINLGTVKVYKIKEV